MRIQKYAIIGDPIEHTMSPFIHSRLFELAGIQAQYDVINIKPGEIGENMPYLNKLNGYNVTMPHKVDIIKHLDRLERKADFYGAVNTVKNDKKVSTGYITDIYGFIATIKSHKMPLNGKIVVLGSGGAATAIACELAVKGCNPIVAVRPQDLRHVATLASVIRDNVANMEVETRRIDRLSGTIDLLINATPAGMYPNVEDCAVSDDIIKNCKNVLDLVYNPLETKLIKTAKANGSNVVNGLSMLIWQAVKSQHIWNDVYFSDEDINQLYEDTKSELKKLI